MQYAWYLLRQNIQSVLQDDPSLAVELQHPHIEGTAPVMIKKTNVPDVVAAAPPSTTAPRAEGLQEQAMPTPAPAPPAAAPLVRANKDISCAPCTQVAGSAGRHRADNSLILLPHLLTRKKLLARLAAVDLKAASAQRTAMQLVWAYFTALDTQGYFAGPVRVYNFCSIFFAVFCYCSD